ncbi:class F sortase [Streptomyces albiflavescens]|uniref:Class F sortase n=1 Tax=Streptomyces albiflavescens TaxID=1623582 RepID=A0A917YB70_9ACTN|nr:class F sortase [Streptomyces albiflavescens]GGN85446.1 class F sortase [Streptomyces albiflavescens]
MAARLSSLIEPEPVPRKQGFRRALTWIVWSALLLVLALNLLGGSGRPFSASLTPGTGAAHPQSAMGSSGRHLPRSTPTRLLIPKISVDAPFTTLSIGPEGRLNPPPADDTNLVGWYADGVSPGEAGTAIIAGHVDTTTSAAVFAGLSDLEKGDKFKVKRADGRTASFVVDSLETFEKDDFPDKRVYADTPDAEVRLITCTGDYDHSAKDYTENLVVFAHLL